MPRLYLGAALAVAFGGLIWNTHRLNEQVAELKLRQAACMARQKDLLEDRESDATVTDPNFFDVPERWILRPGGVE